MNRKIFFIVIMSSYLSSCANVPNTYTPQDFRSNYVSLLSTNEELEIALLNKNSMSQWDATEKENKIRPIANEKCLTPYRNKLTKTLDVQRVNEQPNKDKKIAMYKASLNRAYQESIKLDAELLSCLRPLGVSGQVRFNYEGNYYSTPQYFQLIIKKTDQLISMNSTQNNNVNASNRSMDQKTTEIKLNDEILKEQALINKRLLATIRADREMANAPPGSSEWLERQLFGNPYSRGRNELIEDARQLAMTQEIIRLQRQEAEALRMSAGSSTYGSNCFNVRPYYKKDGTYVRGHMRCK